MANITVTINTPASGPFNLAALFSGNNYSGAVTITPGTPVKPPSQPNYISVQSDPANGANFVIVGDKNITPTAGAKRLAAGAIDAVQAEGNLALAQRWINANVATVIANIEALAGAQ